MESLSSQWPRSRPFGVHMHLSVTTRTATCLGHSEWFLVKRKIRLRSGVSVRRVQQSISRGRLGQSRGGEQGGGGTSPSRLPHTSSSP